MYPKLSPTARVLPFKMIKCNYWTSNPISSIHFYTIRGKLLRENGAVQGTQNVLIIFHFSKFLTNYWYKIKINISTVMYEIWKLINNQIQLVLLQFLHAKISIFGFELLVKVSWVSNANFDQIRLQLKFN